MEVNGKLNAPTALSQAKVSSVNIGYVEGGWVSSTAGLDAVAKRKNHSLSLPGSKTHSPSLQPPAWYLVPCLNYVIRWAADGLGFVSDRLMYEELHSNGDVYNWHNLCKVQNTVWTHYDYVTLHVYHLYYLTVCDASKNNSQGT